MNTILGIVCGVLSILVFAMSAYLKKNFRKGYAAGRKDADNWWIGVESEADQARVKIWREEAQL